MRYASLHHTTSSTEAFLAVTLDLEKRWTSSCVHARSLLSVVGKGEQCRRGRGS
jgi:hypothetical protein